MTRTLGWNQEEFGVSINLDKVTLRGNLEHRFGNRKLGSIGY
jgi:hypothetical protein